MAASELSKRRRPTPREILLRKYRQVVMGSGQLPMDLAKLLFLQLRSARRKNSFIVSTWNLSVTVGRCLNAARIAKMQSGYSAPPRRTVQFSRRTRAMMLSLPQSKRNKTPIQNRLHVRVSAQAVPEIPKERPGEFSKAISRAIVMLLHILV